MTKPDARSRGPARRVRRRNKDVRLRRIIQTIFFILIAALSVNHWMAEQSSSLPVLSDASLHAICPVGGVVSIYQFATVGTFAQKTHEASFVLMIIGFAIAVLFGPVFCGWICPFGTFQEWIGKLGRRLFGRRYNSFIPYRYDRWLRYLRYGVLGWVVYMTARTGSLVFQDYDPYYALFNLWTGEVAVTGYIALAVVVAFSLFVERPFCKYACPYGAVLGVFNLFRVFGIRRNDRTCTTCRACDRSCPMNIPVSSKATVRDHECIACMKCTSEAACPVAGTVELSTRPLVPVAPLRGREERSA